MVRSTKKLLANSLAELLEEKPLSKITVGEIAKRSGVSRMTFYYHFKDIYDLVGWAFSESVSTSIAQNGHPETWQQGMLALFRSMLDNKALITNVFHSISHDQLAAYLYAPLHDIILADLEKLAHGMNVTKEDKSFLADFYKFALVGILFDWTGEGMVQDPHEIVRRIDITLEGNLQLALKNFEQSHGDK